MFYITGDTHGSFRRIKKFCDENKLGENDTIIILGDAGLNYYGDERDISLKHKVNNYGCKIFCIHGNHEMRPQSVDGYTTMEYCGGEVYCEPSRPNILFAKDGEIYTFNGMTCLVIGGAYSVDKYYRMSKGWSWFHDEQPSEEIKRHVEEQVEKYGKVDVVLTHTCPFRYEPIEVFLPGIDQTTVDKSTEIWLDRIEQKLEYKKWYCGHYHTSKKIDNLQFMFEDIEAFMLDDYLESGA